MTIRTLQVIPCDPEANSHIYAKRQIASLQKAGIVVKTFFFTSRTSPRLLIKEWLRLRREVQSFKPHIVHAQYGTITGFLCAFGIGVPLVVTFWGSDLNPVPSINRLKAGLGQFLSQLAALRASHIICVNKQMITRLWWGKGRATTISGGVDLTLFSPRSRDEARSALGWTFTDRIVLFNAGRFPKVKRLDLAEAAVEVAKTLCENLRLVVLRGDVTPESVPLFLNAADCLLVTSDWEGSPNIVKEALACDLPIVSVDVGDVSERLEKVSASKIVSRGPCKLGEAIVEILALNCRSNGREAVQNLSGEKEAERVRTIYEGIIHGGYGRQFRLSTSVAHPTSEGRRPTHEA